MVGIGANPDKSVPHAMSGVGVLDKSMAVLEAVAASSGGSSLSDLMTATGISRATAHRLAVALETHGLLRRDSDGRFLLGLRLVGLGHAAAARWPIAEAARPALETLRIATGESVQLYVRDGDFRVCLVSLESQHELRTIVAEGARLPLDVGSAGRLLGSPVGQPSGVDAEPVTPSVPREPGRTGGPVNQDGGGSRTSGRKSWVASVEERAPGVASVSAAVRDRSGVTVAAVGISGPVGRLGADPGLRFGAAVLAAATQVEAALLVGAAPT